MLLSLPKHSRHKHDKEGHDDDDDDGHRERTMHDESRDDARGFTASGSGI